MGKPRLTNNDFRKAAKKLGCEVATIRAVAEVESRGDGFYPDGFPTILFERHKFRAFTRGRYNKTHPRISGPQGGYGRAGQNQRNKFSEAFALNPEAAMMSCSWGKFQVMGFNWDDLGYSSIHEFVDSMKEGEAEHLDSFVRFVIKNGLKDELQRKDFKTFARIYNGPDYRTNKYDTKMESFYKKFSREDGSGLVNKTGSSERTEESPDQFDDQLAESLGGSTQDIELDVTKPVPLDKPQLDLGNATEVTQTEVTNTAEGLLKQTTELRNEQDVNTAATVQGKREYNQIGFMATIKKDLAAAGVGNLSFEAASGYFQQATGWPDWVTALMVKAALIVLIISIVYLLFRVIHYLVFRWTDAKRMNTETWINTDTSKKDIKYTDCVEMPKSDGLFSKFN